MTKTVPHAFGVDDIALTLVSVPHPVPSAGHFNRALLGTFSRAPKGLGRTALWRTRAAYCQGGLEYALHDLPRPGQPRKYQTDQEAEVVALACSAPPGGRKRWTVRLLTAAARERPQLANVNRETVRQMLKKTLVSPGAS